MTDRTNSDAPEAVDAAEKTAPNRAKRPYEPPQCEKKRSIHRVTLLSGMSSTAMASLSVTT